MGGLLSLALACGAANEKVILHENFEVANAYGLPKGWTYFGTLHTAAVSRDHAFEGRCSLRIEDTSRRQGIGLRSPHLPAIPNTRYYIEWRYFGKTGTSASFYTEFWNGAGKRVVYRSYPSRGTGAWVLRRVTATAPPDAQALTVLLYSSSTNRTVGWFDEVTVRKGRTVKPLVRGPRPPVAVRHPCGLYKPADIARARENLHSHAWGRRTLEGLRRRADFWMNCPDSKLSYWIPDLSPFRVVDCPKCGAGWRFAWTGNDRQIRCRKCGFTWPDPNYSEDHVQTFPDPTGAPQKIPYYKGKPSAVYGSAKSSVYRLSGRLRCNRTNRLLSLGSLGKVYALTDEIGYAKRVRSVLLRLAEVYPHYLPHDWKRVYTDYRNLQSGKLSGWKLSDAVTFIQLTTAYDLTYNSGVYSAADKSKIEEGCFREFTRLMTATSPRGCCINDGPTAMAAGALAGIMLGDHDAIAWAIEPPDGFIGFLEQYYLRAGHWYEASPAYEGMTLSQFYVLPEALRGYSDPPTDTGPDRFDRIDLFEHPLMKKVLTAAAYERMPDGFLPPSNDSHFGARFPTIRAEENYFWHPTERNRRLVAWAMGGHVQDTGNEYSLFRRDPHVNFAQLTALDLSARSIVRPDVGWGILRTGDGPDDAALVIDYGPFGSGHGHPDRLNIIYYDFGKELVTDLGYLSWGHPYQPWLHATASHNEVIVDGEPQARAPGALEAWCGKGPVQGMICSAPEVYPGKVKRYRRSLLFVGHGPGKRYAVDCFAVHGGHEHQYAFHGDGETFKPPTLAFQNAEWKTLGDPDTGYKWIEELKQAPAPAAFTCEWISDTKAHLGMRLHMMGKPGTHLAYGRAPGLRDHRRPFDKVDLYPIYVRRSGPDNRFLAVIEGFRGTQPGIQVRALEVRVPQGRASAAVVRCGDRTDVAVFADEDASKDEIALPAYPGIIFSGRMGFVSFQDEKPVQLWMLGASRLTSGTLTLRSTPVYRGKIIAADPKTFTVSVDADIPPGTAWAGQQMIVKGRVDGAYVMHAITRDNGRTRIHLADDPILTLHAGDSFTIVPAAGLRRMARDTWRTIGETAMVEQTGATWNTAWIRTASPDASWKRAPVVHPAAGASRTVLSPDSLGPDGAVVWLGPSPPNAPDKTPPRFRRIEIDGHRFDHTGALGRVPSARRVVVEFDAPTPIDSESVSVKFRGTVAGPIPASLEMPGRTQAGARQFSLILTPERTPLPDDDYRLTVTLTDIMLRPVCLAFQVHVGAHILPFEKMEILDSSGRTSKALRGLSTLFYRSRKPGDFVTFAFKAPAPDKYAMRLRLTLFPSYGTFQVLLDGKELGHPVDAYSPGEKPISRTIDLGTAHLAAGTHRLTLRVTGKNPKADDAFIGVRALILTKAGPRSSSLRPE